MRVTEASVVTLTTDGLKRYAPAPSSSCAPRARRSSAGTYARLLPILDPELSLRRPHGPSAARSGPTRRKPSADLVQRLLSARARLYGEPTREQVRQRAERVSRELRGKRDREPARLRRRRLARPARRRCPRVGRPPPSQAGQAQRLAPDARRRRPAPTCSPPTRLSRTRAPRPSSARPVAARRP